MITFLYGPDGYRRNARKKTLLETLRTENKSEFGFFGGEDESALEALNGFWGTPSLFREKRIAILHNVPPEEKWARSLEVALKRIDVGVLLVSDSKPEKEFSFLLKKPVQCELFEFLEGNGWRSFINKEAADRNVALGASTLNALADEYENNTWGLIAELEKLRGLGKRSIETHDLLLAYSVRKDFWDLTSRLVSNQRGARLEALEEMLTYEDPAKIFYILAARLRGREDATARADLAIKSGKIDYEEALLGLLL